MPVLAASNAPTVISVDPTSAPNDLDISIIITGTGFTAELSGMLVVTQPTAFLGNTALVSVTWVSSITLQAVVPWSLTPDLYALAVINPDGESASLSDAFTVTQGIGEWSTGGPYGGWIESLAIGDSQDDTVFSTVNNVGLFRSLDGGASRELIFIEIGYLNELEVDPTNTDRLYIAKQASGKTGLYQSEDGGDTWAHMPQPIPGTNTRVFLAFANPHNGTLFGALRADIDDPSCANGCGLFKYDETNQTWIRLEESGLLDENTRVTAEGFDPQDPLTMYAGLVGGLVLKSTDGGQTWSSLGQTPLSYIHKLVVNPVNREPWICSPGGQLPGGLHKYHGDQWVSLFNTQTQRFTEVKNIVFDPSVAGEQTQHV